MSKRGGYQGGMPSNMNNLMKQAQRMQAQMQAKQKELDAKEFTASAGGGAVTVTVMGDKSVKDLTIAQEAVDPDDVETLQDMILAALNEAMQQVDAETEKLVGGMGMGM